MLGFPHENDRSYLIDTGDFIGEIREYNDELTGFDERFSKLDPSVFHYGGNAYYITGSYCSQKGWTVHCVKAVEAMRAA